MHCLARDAGVSQATGYRYLHEGIDVLATQAPDLHEVLDRCREEEISHVILDGMLVESDRLAGTRDNGNDLCFSQKHKGFGGNVQFLSAPNGTPLWVSDVEPGSTPDITAARLHVLPALYKAAADGLPTLADKGYIGAGIGIRVPVRLPKGKSERALDADTRITNSLIRDLRSLGERTAAELKERWRTLKRVTLSPSHRRHSPRRPHSQPPLEVIFTVGSGAGAVTEYVRSVSSPRRFEPRMRCSRTRLTDAVHRRH
uniref:transposase family protein n=1 Tax=Streptomyces sp. CHD11 TaxID=2741325 RepID=UPI001BFC3886|nr:transposase family protein [Streptomyces sp. CHD11]